MQDVALVVVFLYVIRVVVIKGNIVISILNATSMVFLEL